MQIDVRRHESIKAQKIGFLFTITCISILAHYLKILSIVFPFANSSINLSK
jgi:hypothetical protein